MIICIGTKNPAKAGAVKEGFSSMPDVEFLELDVSSGVSAQPFSDEETITGAINRAKNALAAGKGDIGIGLEGGVKQTEHGLLICNWGALVLRCGRTYIGAGACIPLPADVADALLAGEELGPVMDRYANKKNVRHNEGAIGVFTNGKITRQKMFAHVMESLVGQYEYELKTSQ